MARRNVAYVVRDNINGHIHKRPRSSRTASCEGGIRAATTPAGRVATGLFGDQVAGDGPFLKDLAGVLGEHDGCGYAAVGEIMRARGIIGAR